MSHSPPSIFIHIYMYNYIHIYLYISGVAYELEMVNYFFNATTLKYKKMFKSLSSIESPSINKNIFIL